MSGLRNLLLSRIDESLDTITAAPRMWGSPESLELQALLLLEVRLLATRPHASPGELRDAYEHFVAGTQEDAPATLLSCILRDLGRQHELPSLLQRFREEVALRLPAENPFEHYDLVVELELKRGQKIPAFSEVCSYYEDLQHTIRSLAKPPAGKGENRRLARAAIDTATDYPIPDIHIIPENGAGPRIRLPLQNVPTEQLSMIEGTSAGDMIRAALERAGRVAVWASNDKPEREELHDMFPQMALRKKVASETLNIVPSQDFEAVRLGGKLLESEQITFQPKQAPNIVPVLQEGQPPKRFNVTGTIRAIDLDQRWFRLNSAHGSRKCWVTFGGKDLDTAKESIDSRVHVIGEEYRAPNRHSFVVVTSVTPL